MTRYKILIIEDELIISETIASMLKELGYDIAGQSKTEKEAVHAIQSLDFDLALIDINLEGGEEGIKIAGLLRNKLKPFIYLTSYSDEHTLERAKHTMPGSYIVKPFTKRDLYSNIEVVMAREIIVKEISKKHRIELYDGYKTVIIFAEDLLWIKSDGVYLEVRTIDRKILQRTTFQELLPKFPEEFICRVHRSWAVNINYIREITSKSLSIKDQKIPISESYRKKFHNRLSNNKMFE